MKVGDAMRIETPGAGGYGSPAERSVAALAADLKGGKAAAPRLNGITAGRRSTRRGRCSRFVMSDGAVRESRHQRLLARLADFPVFFTGFLDGSCRLRSHGWRMRVARLVDAELLSAGQRVIREQTPILLLHRFAIDVMGLHFFDEFRDVVTHEVERLSAHSRPRWTDISDGGRPRIT